MDSNITRPYRFNKAENNASRGGASDWQNDVENEWKRFHQWCSVKKYETAI